MDRSIDEMWIAYLTASDKPLTTPRPPHWHFCDNQIDADACAALVLSDRKRATTPSLWFFKSRGIELPAAGDLEIVTDWKGVAQCIIRTTAVSIVRFCDVTEQYAMIEGEGDRSLAFWRSTHWEYYQRELAGTDYLPSEEMPVVCQYFERVYPMRHRNNLSYISPKAAVKQSLIHGRGLFAVERIGRGEIVCVKGGHIFDHETLHSMPDWYRAAEVPIADNLFIGPMVEEDREGSMIFSNHSCEPNIGVQGQIVFIAMRDIAAGEELTHDWATTDDDEYRLDCNCGAATCRKVITGQDWRKKELQEKYKGFMSWYLERKIKGA
jgi:uncharacterized protein YhfF